MEGGNEGDELLFLTLRSSSIVAEDTIHSISELSADKLVDIVIRILTAITGESDPQFENFISGGIIS